MKLNIKKNFATEVPALRVKAMDDLGVQTQVVYPTLFLVFLTDDAALEIALCKAYNRFVSEACSKTGDRLRWIAVLPLRSIEASLEEMHWAKEHGAVGLFFRGLENYETQYQHNQPNSTDSKT
jgi:predicted TIM-barrel fold metal-dependent hydrolase